MRNDLIESLLIGAGVALLALAVHAWADGAAAAVQLLALALAGMALAGLQLAFAYYRGHSSGEEDIAPGQPPRARRNQFLRELTSDWTGLEDMQPERQQPGDTPAPPDTTPPDRRPEE
ncbi:MAG TPA: hypothetical protein PLO33_05840 [Kouleothrix sp.]|uniref:hypothetical protein n=1 Tax=Kouleothrix sp. TaxID=2779161 RepID=UPI002B86AD92|nr:hypothetical protein [Kouleothrix sp.]HRC75179.1 hypothetical protein [Kouleothrix sp.]